MDLLFIPKLQRVVLCLNRFVPRSGALIPIPGCLGWKAGPDPAELDGLHILSKSEILQPAAAIYDCSLLNRSVHNVCGVRHYVGQ